MSLERIIEESRETYYDALDRSSRAWHTHEHDAHPWRDYFWGVLIRAYYEFEVRVATLRDPRPIRCDERSRAGWGRRHC